MKLVGITGTHGTGKTTLAKEMVVRAGWGLAKTDVSGVFIKHGKDPRVRMSLIERMDVQDDILDTLVEQWREARKAGEFEIVVTDRTPYCFIAFVLAEISGYDQLTEEENRRVVEYVTRCERAALEFFDLIAYLPMVIPFVPAISKVQAVNGQAYREHYDRLLTGCLRFAPNLHYMVTVNLVGRVVELDQISVAI